MSAILLTLREAFQDVSALLGGGAESLRSDKTYDDLVGDRLPIHHCLVDELSYLRFIFNVLLKQSRRADRVESVTRRYRFNNRFSFAS